MVRVLYILVLCLGLVGTCWANISGVETTEPFAQSLALDPDSNYLLFWNFNDTHVTFEVHVRTRGWVGFGFSDNGNMYPADVAIGWIDSEGGHHFADRHTTEHAMPQKDKSQDWFLLAALEDDFGTVLKFQRKKDTCDAAEDKVIQEGTSRIIYAYGKEDPASDDDIQYHGSTRGTRSVALFNADTVPHTLPDDIIHFDFLNYNFIMPNDTTTYWCRGFTLPDIGKHHLIEFEPVITPGNELNVHHILLYRCSSPDPSLIEGKSGPCYINRPSDLPKCQDVFLAWAIGGQAFYFPENVGLPVGDPNESVYYITETHYDNPTRRTDVLDNSGLRITLTPNLRPQDAGIIMAGQNVNRYQVVPPYQEAFYSKGYCSQDCLNKSMSQEDVEEIKVFAACQHAHLLGEEIKTRHFRDGKEIEPIIVDPSYDFNFQETLHLPSERIVKNTDSVQVDCVYNSRGRDRATYGGFSTQEEMCLTFLYYYPLLPVTQCTSTQTLMPFVKNLKETTAVYNAMDWDNATAVEMLTQVMQDSVVNHNCIGTKLEIPQKERTVKFVEQEPKDPYIPPDHGCFD